MEKICIFAGTTEGRRLSDTLSENGISCTVSVATEYGAQTMEEAGENVKLLTGRLSREEIAAMLKKDGYTLVVDATHPFAVEATKAIKGACEDSGVRYLRLSRQTSDNPENQGNSASSGSLVDITYISNTSESHDDPISSRTKVDITHISNTAESHDKIISSGSAVDITHYSNDSKEPDSSKSSGSEVDITHSQNAPVYVDTLQDALSYLKTQTGSILCMTGSKEIGKVTAGLGDSKRVFARVLPSVESIQLCEKAGLTGKQILAMQGPFSEEMNIAMLHSTGASFLLTKETGKTGGFTEKLSAANKLGVRAVIISNPENQSRGLSYEETIKELEKLLGLTLKRKDL